MSEAIEHCHACGEAGEPTFKLNRNGYALHRIRCSARCRREPDMAWQVTEASAVAYWNRNARICRSRRNNAQAGRFG